MAEHFNSATELPIEPDDIRVKIIKAGIVGQILFYEDTHLPVGVIRGFMDLHEAEYLTPPLVADIYFAGQMGNDWNRLVWTKEMLNIFDSYDGGEDVVASDPDKVSQLVSEMVAPPEIYSLTTVFDRVALLWAIFLLFPKGIRDKLMPKYEAGRITIEEIAAVVEIPTRYVQWAMSDKYLRAYEILMA
jgi:hypothetical protein